MRVGLVGCGRWGKLILRDLVDIGCTVSVVARSEGSRINATGGGADQIVAEIADLTDVDGIVVATPTVTHADVLFETLGHGVPVFVEKPMTSDPIAARDLAARAPDRLFVMDKWRYHPGVEVIAGMVRSGEYGALHSIRSRRLSWGQPHDDVDAVWVLLPHDLSIVLEIVGSLPAPLHAVGGSGGGSNAWISAHLGPEPWCVLEISSMHPSRERQVLADFTDATVQLGDAYASSVRVIPRGGDEDAARLIPLPDTMPLRDELAAFVAHLEGGPPPRSSAADGAAIVAHTATLREMAGL